MKKRFIDFILLQKGIITLFYNNFFFITLYLLALLFSYVINTRIGSFILGSIFGLRLVLNNFNYIDLIIFFILVIFYYYMNII